MNRRINVTLCLLCLSAGCGIHESGQGPAETGRGSRYLSPVAVAKGPDERTLYIANQTGRSVQYVDARACKVIKKVDLPRDLTGIGISPEGKTLFVTSRSPTGEIFVIDVEKAKLKATLRAGHTPMSPRVTPDGGKLFVCNRFDNTVSVFDLAENKKIADIKTPPKEPFSLAITPDGKKVIVANHLNGDAVGDETSLRVSILDAQAHELLKHFPLSNGATGAKQVAISPDGKWAYVTHILAHYQMPTSQIERGWMNTNALAIIDVDGMSYYNTVLLDEPDLGSGNPWAVCVEEDRIVVAHGGTHELNVIDRRGMHDRLERAAQRGLFEQVPDALAFLADLYRRTRLAGNGARSLAIVGSRAYVVEYFTDTLSVVDIDSQRLERVNSYALGPGVEPDIVRRGHMLFNDAEMCFQMWQSCASCHPGGRADALNWDLLNDGMGNPRNTKSMLFSHQTPPAMITGVRATADVAVRKGITHILFAVRPEEDAKAIDAYLRSLRPVASPYLVDGKLSESARRGRAIFEGRAGCSECHNGRYFTDGEQYDVGTADEPELDTPTLVETWRTSPYLFDGRAATVMEVLTKYNKQDKHGLTSRLTRQQLEDLEQYVLSIGNCDGEK